MSHYALEIKNLDTTFKTFSLKNISFNLKCGTIMGLVGENGAGKTTLLKSIMNVYYSENGIIRVYGHDHVDDEVMVKNLIGYVAAEDYFVPQHSLKFLARHFSILYDIWNTQLFDEYVTKWQLPLTKPFSTYSTGMKTKAMLILALAHEPKLLLLDEPTAGLDPLVKTDILDILRDFVEDGEKSVLFSTHSTGDLDKVADYITLISNGALLESCQIDEVAEQYLIVSGSSDELKSHHQYTIGMTTKNGISEALIERNYAAKLKNDKQLLTIKQPTIEEFMIHMIHQNH